MCIRMVLPCVFVSQSVSGCVPVWVCMCLCVCVRYLVGVSDFMQHMQGWCGSWEPLESREALCGLQASFGSLLWVCGRLCELGLCCKADWVLISTLNKYKKHLILLWPQSWGLGWLKRQQLENRPSNEAISDHFFFKKNPGPNDSAIDGKVLAFTGDISLQGDKHSELAPGSGTALVSA